jgi:NAD(P)-dependent dehydrogenase (short-subunit alcohol dehydrogenase family)|tara:strand:- start:457 stop:1227 length:771 start_codon:yes stop_codon:yes gene_type:complete
LKRNEQFPLEGHTALVTSSSRNLGAEIVRVLAASGANVITTYFQSKSAAEDLVDELADTPGTHSAVHGDTRSATATCLLLENAIAAAPGTIDILVNNSGPFSMTPFTELTVDEWDRIWNGNVTAAFLATQMLAPQMRSLGWGRIINVSAGSAYLRNHSIYTIAKEAMLTLTESMALELAPEITVNCIAPGQIAESADDMAEFDPSFVDRAIDRTPAGRLVTRNEVAGLLLAMCLPEFDMVTGATIPIEGGWRINRF